MQRGSPQPGKILRWEIFEGLPVSGSMIVGNTAGSPKNNLHPFKSKIDDHGFKQGQLVRHDSEKQFLKPQFSRNFNYFTAPEQKLCLEEEHKQRVSNALNQRIRNSDIYAKRKSNSKIPQLSSGFFRGRNSGGKPNPLKQTSSTVNSNDGNLSTHKSQKTFPSFLRNQVKSPGKNKDRTKEGIGKQNFKFIRKLGEGKFGSVYLAQQIYTGFIVGLKIVDKRRIIKDYFMTQFIRQLKIQKFLEHPNIIKVYGCFSDQQKIYIILELGSDGQLYDVISNGTTLSEETTSFIIGNLLDAVNLMHKYKILHRDIKPENIVLVHGNIKLCDFGWAVNKKEELRSTFCGTPLYLSPQLIQGSRYDQKVDIWAVGILAYELYYGCSPFDIEEQEDLPKIITSQIHFPSSRSPSKQFRQFLSIILKKNPKERMDGKNLLNLEFIKKYRELETCEELCR